MDGKDWLTLVGIVLAGGIGALLDKGANALKLRADSKRADREVDAREADRLRSRLAGLTALESELEVTRIELAAARQTCEELVAEVGALRGALPAHVMAARMAEGAAMILWVLAPVKPALVHSRKAGSSAVIEWAGDDLWRGLGYDGLQEFLSIPWELHCHHADLQATRQAEAQAHYGPVEFRGRFLCKAIEGKPRRAARLLWRAAPYNGGGTTIATCEIMGYEEVPEVAP